MKVLLDGQTIDDEFGTSESIEEAIRGIQAHHCPPSKLVVGIRCDDRDVPSDQIASRLRDPVASVNKLEVFTDSRHELVLGAMTQASAALQESETAVTRVGELLNEGKTADGIMMLGECLEVWQQIHEAVTKSIHMLELDLETLTINDEPMLDIITKPRDVLIQVKQALVAQDHVLLADVLQYEFNDVTDKWYAVIAHVREAAEEMRDAHG
jgi:hypothetical protein